MLTSEISNTSLGQVVGFRAGLTLGSVVHATRCSMRLALLSGLKARILSPACLKSSPMMFSLPDP